MYKGIHLPTVCIHDSRTETAKQRRAAGKSGRAALFEFASMIVSHARNAGTYGSQGASRKIPGYLDQSWFYSGMMPMITAKIMQRIEKIHT